MNAQGLLSVAMSLRPQSTEIKPPGLPNKAADAASPAETGAAAYETQLKWSDLTETEKSAASLGVNPEEWKPIGFMNAAHHETLLKSNALDGDLAKKIEAYKAVASGQQ